MAAEVRMTGSDDLERVLALHFDPRAGSAYWLERQHALGIDVRQAVRTIKDLQQLGPMEEAALSSRPILDFVPRSLHDSLCGAVVTETGGTTGAPKRTIFLTDEFHRAFVDPFVAAARHARFPEGGAWLWVGPSGPHVIHQAAVACAAALGAAQPFSIDFDPRWYRKLPEGSTARDRYILHLLEQAGRILEREPITVLFTTPVLQERLARIMSDRQREAIRGVHYGGMRVSPELLRAAQVEWFPAAVHLAGYGNSLFGVCMELGGSPDRRLRYFPYGGRHHVRVDEDGRVWMSRLDETVLIANLPERDAGTTAQPPSGAPAGFGSGVEDPHPIATMPDGDVPGIY